MPYRRTAFAVVLLSAAAGLAGCSGAKPGPPAPPPPLVTVVKPVSVPVRDYWSYNGYLESTKAVEVRSKIRGFLTGVLFDEGTEVAAGDLLYTIDKLEYQTAVTKATAEEKKAEAEIQNWKAQIVQSKAELDRVTRSFKSGTESKTELDKSQAAYDVNVAQRDAAIATRDAAAAALHSSKILLGYTEIKAKICGRISRTHVNEGNLVQADTTLLTTILKVDELYVYFDAPEADLIAYQQSLIATTHPTPESEKIPVEVGVTNEDGYPHAGKIDFRENRVDNSTGTIRIRGLIPNPLSNGTRLLFPGMYARVRVPKGKPTQHLALPEDCLLSGQEGRFVYVVAADGKVEKRPVTVGAVVWKAPPAVVPVIPPSWFAINPNPKPSAAGKPPALTRQQVKSVVAITAGLKADDRVIFAGLHLARPGVPVAPDEWALTPPPDTTQK